MGIKLNFERPWAVALAKIKLRKILDDPLLKNNGVKTALAIKALRQTGLTKGEIKIARKEMGVVSEFRDGEQYWFLSKKGQIDHE